MPISLPRGCGLSVIRFPDGSAKDTVRGIQLNFRSRVSVIGDEDSAVLELRGHGIANIPTAGSKRMQSDHRIHIPALAAVVAQYRMDAMGLVSLTIDQQ